MPRFQSLILLCASATLLTSCYEYHVVEGPAPMGPLVRVRFSPPRPLRAALPRTTGEARVLDLRNVVSLDGQAIRREGQLLSIRVLAAIDDRGVVSELPADVTLDVLLDSGTTVAVRRLSWNRTALIGLAVLVALGVAQVESMFPVFK